MLDRNDVAELYQELFMTGQTTVKLSDWMTPAELFDMPDIADSWLGDRTDSTVPLLRPAPGRYWARDHCPNHSTTPAASTAG